MIERKPAFWSSVVDFWDVGALVEALIMAVSVGPCESSLRNE